MNVGDKYRVLNPKILGVCGSYNVGDIMELAYPDKDGTFRCTKGLWFHKDNVLNGEIELVEEDMKEREIEVGDVVTYSKELKVTRVRPTGGVTPYMIDHAGEEWTVVDKITKSSGLVVAELSHPNTLATYFFALDDLSLFSPPPITSLYTERGRNGYQCGDTELRWAGKRKRGQRQLIIKYSDNKQTSACVKEEDIPKLAAALLNYM